ncbi:aromatic acid exporter family protein [Yinghuangia sp. ASG 101]|uniref:FUSC family protein n=1 Tax=Yinghuangia sp. ASG 101 TaxID=2896848 RepID=UPI001E2F1AE8|nr:aromatic acid exporter family protein [Yinghuangia sp. ASG 101]UGQ12984.1 aromatic acid exporter family protein [Yinghuangia sp. ASG 101]
MPIAPEPVLGLVKRRNQPVVVRTLRSTVAAVLAFLVALWLSGSKAPLLAPLTALLVVQVTLYSTLTTGIRRMFAVLIGVLIAVGFTEVVNLNWWSLGLLILMSLVAGHLLRVDPFVEEVAISGMLVLGVSSLRAAHTTAAGRVGETVIGVVVGMLFNLVYAPPVFVQPAGEAIEDLCDRMCALLRRIGRELRSGATRKNADSWLDEARELDGDIVQADGELSRAEESLRLNPRAARHALHAGIVLRSGLDTLEHCAVTMRSVCRGLADLTRESERYESVYPTDVAEALDRLLGHLADAVKGFGRMVTAEVTARAEQAEAELAEALAESRADRDHIANLLRSETEYEPDTWELHGSLLAGVDRILGELDVEKRAEPRLAATKRVRSTTRAARHLMRLSRVRDARETRPAPRRDGTRTPPGEGS